MRSITCKALTLLVLLLSVSTAGRASHTSGGQMSYQYIKDTMIAGQQMHKYEVLLTIYQDCITGQPEAIAQDNPAYITLYNGSSSAPILDSAYYSPASGGMFPAVYASDCGNIYSVDLPPSCELYKVFSKDYYLPASTSDYTFVYQRCCRVTGISNLVNAGNTGQTLYCTIPAIAPANSSAVFTGARLPMICMGKTFNYTFTATDADGDSLTYEMANALTGAAGSNIKPSVASPPPYDAVTYAAPYTGTNPISNISLNPATGALQITPGKVGNYLLCVACKEWRAGVLINTTYKEFSLYAINCSAITAPYTPYAGGNRAVVVDSSIQFHAVAGASFSWSPATFLSDPNIADPIGTFTQPGDYTYTITGISDSGCKGTDVIHVHVLEHSDYVVPNAFSPDGNGINDLLIAMQVGTATLQSFSIYNRYGNRLYNWSPASLAWDGKYKGRLQEQGVYMWELTFTDNTGTTRKKSGNVTLLR